MTIDFDLRDVSVTEFGVSSSVDGNTDFCAVPVDSHVQDALLSMASRTHEQMEEFAGRPSAYSPAEKYDSKEYLIVHAGDGYETLLRALHDAKHLPTDRTLLRKPQSVLSYFARFTDGKNRCLTAIRRASYFKGILRKKLMRFDDGTLEIVTDNVFKLDDDFDVLVDSEHSHILRPKSFEALCELKEAILSAVPHNVQEIAKVLSFIDFGGVEEYATSHLRAARYLASIRTQELKGLDRDALLGLCQKTGVVVRNEGGTLVPGNDKVGFLEVLDRRRYEVELVHGQPERFRAGSRDRIGRP